MMKITFKFANKKDVIIHYSVESYDINAGKTNILKHYVFRQLWADVCTLMPCSGIIPGNVSPPECP